MEERAFSLLEEPWICVITSEGCTAKRSLTQALFQAHQIRDLAGESKSQDSAILRLLLAVVYAVFLRKDERGSQRRSQMFRRLFGGGGLCGIWVPSPKLQFRNIWTAGGSDSGYFIQSGPSIRSQIYRAPKIQVGAKRS